MTTTQADPATPSPVDEALRPLHDELLAAAQRDAAGTAAEAEQQAETMLAQAREEAEQLRAQARADGERDAEIIRRDQIARARRRARGVVLAAQSEALDGLRRGVTRRLRQAWDDPERHDALQSRLTDLARAELGDECTVHDLPDGGIVAERDGARVRYLLADLADEAIDDLADEVERLWSP